VLLEQLLSDHAHATAEVQQLLIDRLGLETGSRVKREAGIIEKLRRQPSLPCRGCGTSEESAWFGT
jgi:hypothetical protein